MAKNPFASLVGKVITAVAIPMGTWAFEKAASYIQENWQEWAESILKKIKAYWNGKNIAVIGATASGKDSFILCLQGKEPTGVHINTTAPEKMESFLIDYPLPDGDDICFNVKEGINVGGEDEDKERYWGKTLENADVVFYLIDFPKVFKELQALDLESLGEDKVAFKLAIKKQNGEAWRILEDMRFLASHAQYQTEKQPSLAILLNKYDKLDGFPVKYIAHATLEDGKEIFENIKPSLGLFCSFMQPLMRRELGKPLKNILPMSCGNLDLFHFFFPSILRAVAGK